MTYLSTPLKATGWEQTLVNDSEGNTILLMPNGHKGLEAVRQATALFAAAPDMLAALEAALPWLIMADTNGAFSDCALPLGGRNAREQIEQAIAKARGEAA